MLDTFEEHANWDACALVDGRLFLDGDVDAAVFAGAVLAKLKSLGFLSELAVTALRAEEAEQK